MKTIKTRDARAALAPRGGTAGAEGQENPNPALTQGARGDDGGPAGHNPQETEQARVDAEIAAANKPPALIGSKILPATLKTLEGNPVPLADVVARAHADSHLTVEDWNALGDDVREVKLSHAIAAMGLVAFAANITGIPDKPVVNTPTTEKRPDLIAVYQEAIDQLKAKQVSFEYAVSNISKVYKLDPDVVSKELTDILNRPDNAKQPTAAVVPTVPIAHGFESYCAMMLAKDPKFEEKMEKIVVTAPKSINIILDNHTKVVIKAGVSRIERFVAEHWYSKANGVTIFEK
jgi:hypothetical protein